MIRLIFGITLLGSIMFHFYGLDVAPPGFYVDEAAGAAHIISLAQTGKDFWGNPPSLFIRALGDGFTTFPLWVSALSWVKFVGSSPFTLRLFTSMIHLFTLLGIFFFLRGWFGKKTELLPAIAIASVIPWGFQFSRIFWDPPLAPFFLFWALAVLYQDSEDPSRSTLQLLLAGALGSLAMHSYPPIKAQWLLLLLFLPRICLREKGVLLIATLVVQLPAIPYFLDPQFWTRTKTLSVFNDYDFNPAHGTSLVARIGYVLKQFSWFFKPDFLLLGGDKNLRHSIGAFGEVSWPGFIALVLCALRGLLVIPRKKAQFTHEQQSIWFFWVGFCSGILPAALTIDANPHALRAIGAWGFIPMAVVISWSWIQSRWRKYFYPFALAFALGTTIFSGLYFHRLFTVYPNISRVWFDDPMPADYPDIGKAYHLMSKQNK